MPRIPNKQIKLYRGDCLDIMPMLEDKSIDLVLTDPPYGITACKWDACIPFEQMWEQLKRITKKNGVIVLFGCQPFTSALVMSNPKMFRYEWVWVKSKITGVLNAKRMPVRKHEQVLVFADGGLPNYHPQGLVKSGEKVKQGSSSTNYGERNKKEYVKENSGCPRDVLEIKSEGKTVHPTQKPVALMEYLIKTYTNEGDTVLDFTMGSGTTGVACKNLNRRFIGIELDKTYFEIARERINAT